MLVRLRNLESAVDAPREVIAEDCVADVFDRRTSDKLS